MPNSPLKENHPSSKKILTKNEAAEMIMEAGKDVESGMEYLYGLEEIINGEKHYKTKYVLTFINR
jgi:hypothetical protein